MSFPKVKLRDVAEVNPRSEGRPSGDAMVSFLAMADVDAGSGTTRQGVLRPFDEVAKGYTQFADRDLLVAKITPCFENGKIAQADLRCEYGAGSTEFHVIRPDRAVIDDRFLLRFLRQPWIRLAGKRHMTGSASQRRVPAAFLAELDVPLPSLREQRVVAQVLDHVDALRDQRRQTVALLDDLARSVFLDMFGAPATNPRGWKEGTLGELIESGPQNGLYKHSSCYGTGNPIVRIDSFYGGRITKASRLRRVALDADEVERYKLREGDILVNRVNSLEYLGKCALVPRLAESTVFESNMMRFAVDARAAHPVYIVTLLQSSYVRNQILSAAKPAVNQASINQTDVRNLRICIPAIAEQRRFAEVVARIDDVKAGHQTCLAELDALFASIQHRAFRGELWADAPAA